MKIATNVARDRFGGIVTSNATLFGALDTERDSIVGLELTSRRTFPGATLFWKYSPHFFHHYVVNCFDLTDPYIVRRSDTYGRLVKRWKPAIDAVEEILKRESPDVVLLNGTFFVPWAIARASKKLGLPIVLRYAGVLQKEVSQYPAAVRKVFLRMERDIIALSSRIIFPSQLCRSTVESEVLTGSLPEWTVIHNPVSPPGFRWRINKRSHDIAAVGRWVAIKNFEAFFEVHRRLRSEGWPHRAFLVTTHTNMRGIPSTVQRIPPMGQEELYRFYSSLGLLLLPSHFETFGNVAAEALVCGTPVLVSKNAGFAEILRAAGLDEMVVDFSDQEAVLSSVKSLCGKTVPSGKVAAVRRLLNPEVIRDRVLAVLREASKYNNGDREL